MNVQARPSNPPYDSFTDGHAPFGELAELFQRYVEATPLGILLIDDVGVITYANESLYRCFQYDVGELSGQPIEILVPDSIKPDHVQLRDTYLAHPQQRLMQGREVRGRRKDGVEIPVAIGLNPLQQNGVVRVACTVLDLSANRQAEQILANFFELSLDLFCIASTRGFFLRVNSNFTRLLGYSEQELLSRPFLDYVHPDDAAATQAAVAVVASGQPVVRFRNRYRQAQGDYLWIEWSALAIPRDEMIFAVGRDVTEEVRYERELEAREQREQAILENTPAVIYLKSVDGKYLYVNQRYADLFSLDSAAVQGKTDFEIFPEAVAKGFVRNDRKVVESRSRITLEESAPHPDGLHTYISAKFPLFDANGNVAAVAGISTDITEHIQTQKLHEQLELAKLFQLKLFPAAAPTIAGLELAGSAVPVAHLCGDYFDFIPTGTDQVTIAIGDVSGHGLGPALAMVEVRSLLRGMLHYGSPNDLMGIIRKLNLLLCDDLPDGCFVTLFLAEIEVGRRRMRYAGAGHPGRLFRAGGGMSLLESTGPVLGLLEAADYPETPELPLAKDDILLMSTDGVTETMNRRRELFGNRRLEEFIKVHRHQPPADMIQQLFTTVKDYAAGRPVNDDMTAIVAKFAG